MPRLILTVGTFFLAAASTRPAEPDPTKAGVARKGGLSLTVTLAKRSFGPADDVLLAFTLKNESDKVLYVGDGHLAPRYHEAGPGRHFEVHVTAPGKRPLHFWSGTLTEGGTAGIRRVFRLRPGEAYKGTILLRAGGEDKDRRGGSFEDVAARKAHVLGRDGRAYSVSLRYQVNPGSHGVWQPPADFKKELLWTGELTSSPLAFEVAGK
jgi:hypothetical protein